MECCVGRKGLYLPGAHSSSLFRSDTKMSDTSLLPCSHIHKYTHTDTRKESDRQALRPAAASALHLLVYILLELKLLTGILHRPVLQLPETEEEHKKRSNKLNILQVPHKHHMWLVYVICCANNVIRNL